MDVPLVVIAPDRDLAIDFSGLIITVVNVQLTFVVRGGVPASTP